MRVLIDAAGATDVGKARSNNEDQFLIARLHKTIDVVDTSLDEQSRNAIAIGSEAHLFVVADGVGGSSGGELASEAAVEILVEHIGRTVGCYYNYNVEAEHDFLSRLEEAIGAAHESITTAYGSGRGGPATTLTMVALLWPRAYLIHVGDTRAYHLRRGKLRQLTRDQTMAEMMVDEGILTEEQAAGSRLEHVLSSAIGASSLDPSVGLIDLVEGDALVLCSDGLTKHVSDEAIGAIAGAEFDARATADRLVQAALDDGGSDNIAVVVARMGSPPA